MSEYVKRNYFRMIIGRQIVAEYTVLVIIYKNT